jgi:hypothetical protein
MAQTREKPKPPPAPQLPSKEDVKNTLPALGQSDEGEEQDESTGFDKIRGLLEDAHASMTSAYEELDRLEAAQG